MTEHLDPDQLSASTTDVLLLDIFVYRSYLLHIQFSRQDNDIRKLRIELQRLRVRNIQLRGQMHFLADTVGILHHSNIARNNSVHTYCVCLVHDLTH